MAEAAERYRLARRRRRAALFGMAVSWAATVGLILLGVRFMGSFSFFMIASLVVGAAGTGSWFALNFRCMVREGELAAEISRLPLPPEELFRLAEEHHVDRELVGMYLDWRSGGRFT